MGIIPAKYFWPGMVIGLLGLTVATQVTILFAANSGNGPQPVEDYYGKAVRYEETQKKERAAENLGWTFQVEFVEADAAGRLMQVHITDARDEPVSGLEASAELRRPSLSRAVATGQLQAVEGRDGVYTLDGATVRQAGLWDLIVEGEHEDVEFRKEMRVNL